MLKKVKMFTDLNDDDQVKILNPLEIEDMIIITVGVTPKLLSQPINY